MRLINADALLADFKARAIKARNWKENAILNGDEEVTIRADATIAFLTEVKLTIENAPTIEPTTVYEFKGCDNCELERPKGKWIEYDDDGLYAGECSCCKWKAVLYESNVLNMNFCPNCGARMEREEDDTEQTER